MDTEARIALATNVRTLRSRLNLSQARLAQKAGIAQTVISYIERTGTKSPTLDVLEALARALGVPVWSLLVDVQGMSDQDIERFAVLSQTYRKLPPEGRDEVLRVAEREQRYGEVRTDKPQEPTP